MIGFQTLGDTTGHDAIIEAGMGAQYHLWALQCPDTLHTLIAIEGFGWHTHLTDHCRVPQGKARDVVVQHSGKSL